MNTADVFKLAHRMEVQGMRFYQEQQDKVKLPRIRELFSFLSGMEKEHAAYIERQADNLEAGRPIEELAGSEEEDRFRAVMARQKVEPENLDQDLGDYSIMRMAYLVEKDFARFYEQSAEQSRGELRDLFTSLAEWEKGHAEMMKQEMGRIISQNALDLGFYPF
jgi:rubrerythrin